MKMHLTLTAIAMFFVSGTALAQNSAQDSAALKTNPHEWGSATASASTAQEPNRVAREAGTGLVEAALEPKRDAREAGTGLTEAALESETVARETETRVEIPGPWGKVW